MMLRDPGPSIRRSIEDEIERLIGLLDVIVGDPDFELDDETIGLIGSRPLKCE